MRCILACSIGEHRSLAGCATKTAPRSGEWLEAGCLPTNDGVTNVPSLQIKEQIRVESRSLRTSLPVTMAKLSPSEACTEYDVDPKPTSPATPESFSENMLQCLQARACDWEEGASLFKPACSPCGGPKGALNCKTASHVLSYNVQWDLMYAGHRVTHMPVACIGRSRSRFGSLNCTVYSHHHATWQHCRISIPLSPIIPRFKSCSSLYEATTT